MFLADEDRVRRAVHDVFQGGSAFPMDQLGIRGSVIIFGNRGRLGGSFSHDERTIGKDPVPNPRRTITGGTGVIADDAGDMTAGFKRRQDVVVGDARHRLLPP